MTSDEPFEPPASPAGSLERRLGELQALYESAPIGLGLVDRELRYVRINPALAAINGAPAEAHIGRTMRDVLAGLADVVEPLVREVLRTGQPAVGLEIAGRTPALPPDCEPHVWLVDYYPVPERGQTALVAFIVRDITELKRSERALRESNERFRLILERAPVILYACGLDLRYTFEAGAHGRAPFAEAVGRSDEDLLPAPQAAGLTALKRRALAEGVGVRGELCLPDPTDEPRTWEFAIEPTRDTGGAITGLLLAGLEITEHKRAEQRQEFLLAELNHRVKNTLAAVRSMVVRTLLDAGASDAVRETLVGRLQAFARIHELLSGSDWRGVRLHALVEAELAPYGAVRADGVTIDGPDLLLASTAVPMLAMAFHELAVNAAKHGALSVGRGRVEVTWRLERTGAGRTVHAVWRERDGPPATEPTRTGFGRQLIERGVTYELGGRTETRFTPEGFVWEAWLPAERCLRKGS